MGDYHGSQPGEEVVCILEVGGMSVGKGVEVGVNVNGNVICCAVAV